MVTKGAASMAFRTAWMRSRKARTPAGRSFAGTAAAVAYSSRKSPPAEKTDFRALAIMQTEVSGAIALKGTTDFFEFRKHGRANFVGRSMIEGQFDNAFAPFPSERFALEGFHLNVSRVTLKRAPGLPSLL